MDIDDKAQTQEFSSLLEELRKQLLEASMLFDASEQTWPTAQVVDVLNRYKGFFQPTRKALFDQFSIKVCNVISNDRRSPSFHKVFKMLDTYSNLAPNIDVQSLRKRLKQHKVTITNIENYRNARAAHWDIDIAVEKKPVLYGDSKKLLKELQDVFNEICRASTKNLWSFKVSQHGDSAALSNDLNELWIIRKKRIGELGPYD